MDGRRANALVVARPCGRGVVRRGGECPAAAGFSLLRCLVFVALLVPFSVVWAVCARGAVVRCVYV